MISQIEAYASDLIWDYPVSLDVPELDPLGLLKYISPVIQTDYENDYEKIIEYMNIMHDERIPPKITESTIRFSAVSLFSPTLRSRTIT